MCICGDLQRRDKGPPTSWHPLEVDLNSRGCKWGYHLGWSEGGSGDQLWLYDSVGMTTSCLSSSFNFEGHPCPVLINFFLFRASTLRSMFLLFKPWNNKIKIVLEGEGNTLILSFSQYVPSFSVCCGCSSKEVCPRIISSHCWFDHNINTIYFGTLFSLFAAFWSMDQCSERQEVHWWINSQAGHMQFSQ